MMLALFALVAATHPEPPLPPAASPGQNVVREVIVMDRGAGASQASTRVLLIPRQGIDGDRSREVRVVRVREVGKAVPPSIGTGEDCTGRSFTTEADGEKDGKKVRTRIRLCSKAGASPAATIQGLERASRRIADDTALPEEVRTKVLTALDAEITRLKQAD